MKVLFVADHHIKLGQKNVPREWARNRFSLLWDKVHKIAEEEKVNAIVHGGDIFDRVPTPEEVGIMLEMFKALRGDWVNIVYPGNHEATTKYKSFWEEFHPLKHEKIQIISEFTELEEGVHILPYTDLKRGSWHGTKGRILFTHVRGEILPHVKPEIDLSLFDTWDTVFAGDLHSHENSQRNIVYPGSPITTSFHRKPSSGSNGVLIVDTADSSWKFVELKLPQLIRLTVDSPDDMVKTEYHHTIYELVGDAVDLANVHSSELLDKKIVDRNTEATLQLKDLTIEQELEIYLTEVEKLSNPQEIIDEYVDIKNTILV